MMETVLYMFTSSMGAPYFLFEKIAQSGVVIVFLLFITKGMQALSTMELRYDYDPVSGVGIYGKHPTDRRNERGGILLNVCITVAVVAVVAIIANVFPETRVLIVILGLVATFPTIMLWYAIKMKSTKNDAPLDNEPLYH